MSCNMLLAGAGEICGENDMSIRSSANPSKCDEDRSVVLFGSPLGLSVTILIEEFDFWRYTGGGLSGMHEWVCEPVLMPALVLGADAAFSVNASLC